VPPRRRRTQEPDVAALLPPDLDLTPAKRRLYEVALDLFGEAGYHAVSIRDIATALGQHSSAIYFHVGSKQELLYDLELIGHRTHLEGLQAALASAGPDPVAQLTAVVRAHLRTHFEYPSLARVTNRELRALAPDQLAEVLAIRAQAEQVFVDVIEHGVGTGAFTTDDAFLDGKAIGAMGIRIPEWWTPDAPRTREQVVERYTAYALKLVT
jgi:AcrR family transcriptional regulator